MAKNAGKTTVLNQILSEYNEEVIALTSIGLDGEKIDTVTNKPKPRIEVKKNTLIATAYECLKECTFQYVLHERTNINTALGEIVIVEAISKGLALVAGPSRKSEMIKLVKALKKYDPLNIFIDGALFRKSIAASNVSDSIILASGASYNIDMKVVINDTKILVDQLHLKQINERVYNQVLHYKFNAICTHKNEWFRLQSLWDEVNKYLIQNELSSNSKYLYLKGALTDNIIKQIIEVRHKLKNLTIIVRDATHIVCSYNFFKKLEKMNVKVKVVNEIELLFVTYNPHSPYGYDFNNGKFRDEIKNKISTMCINVLEDTE